MKITENMFYKTRKGDIVQVVYVEEMDVLYPVDVLTEDGDMYTVTLDGFLGADCYQENGVEIINNSINDDDLVEELPKAEFPELYL